MPVSQVMTFTATPPTTGETPATFNANAIACWVDLKDNIVPDLNTAFTQMNDLETNVNAKEVSTVYSADIASTAANFQGEWTSQGYTLGQSVSSGGTTYMCKLTHATGFVVTNTTYWQPTGYAAIVNGATAKTTPVDADIIGIGDSAASFALKKLTWANIKATILSSFGVMISTATAKTVPVDNDIFIIGDSASTNASKKTTWANIKTTLGLIFAPIASPAFTDTPTAPTAAAGTNTTQLATTAFVNAKVNGVIHVRDEKPSDTGGGSSVAGLQDRILNTVVTNTISGASLASNNITLPAGTYRVKARAPAYATSRSRLRFVNVTDGTVALIGSSTHTAVNVVIDSHVEGVITIGATKVFKLTQYIQTASATIGLGVETNDTLANVYSEVIIERLV